MYQLHVIWCGAVITHNALWKAVITTTISKQVTSTLKYHWFRSYRRSTCLDTHMLPSPQWRLVITWPMTRPTYCPTSMIRRSTSSSLYRLFLTTRNSLVVVVVTSDKGGGKCFCPCLFVCLSVCLLAILLKNACVDLDEMLRVDRYRDMDELINFWARSGL